MSKYPEHDKLQNVKNKSQWLGEFFEWLRNEKKINLFTYEDEVYSVPNGGRLQNGHEDPVLVPFHTSTSNLLAEFLDIDLKKLEDEKDVMLAELREASSGLAPAQQT